MASQGPLYPGTVTTEIGPSGDNDWTNEANIGADDDTLAAITAATFDAGDDSFRLKAQNFGFTLPAGATVDGIVVEIERSNAAGAASDNEVQLYDSTGTLVGTNKAAAGDWPTALTLATYGSPTDTWTAGLDDVDVNNANFGVAFIVNADAANTDIGVDFIRVTVHYTAGATVESGAFGSDGTADATAVGASIAAAAFSSDGAGSLEAVGGTAGGVEAGAWSTAGEGTLTAAGAAVASGAFSSDGSGTFEAAGSSVTLAAGAMSAEGDGTFTASGAADAAGAFIANAAGEATVQFTGAGGAEEEEIVPCVGYVKPAGGGSSGWGREWWAVHRRRRREALEREDEELLAAMKAMAPDLLKHHRSTQGR